MSKSNISLKGIIEDLSSSNLLFRDQYKEPWIAVNKKGTELYQIGSKPFRDWLCNFVLRKYGVILKNNQPKDVASTLSGIALYSGAGEISLEPRVHKIDNVIWYDLGREAVKITKSGWEVVKEPPVLFCRYSHQKRQVMPVKGGNIQDFHKLVNIKDWNDWHMFLTFASATLLPDIAKPVLIINGSQGAGKSTPMKMLKELIDPSSLNSTSGVKNEAELARLANMHILLFFDNLSRLSWDMSDDICRLVTGDGFSKRKLYTDNDEIVYSFKRALMMNGIASFVSRADLLDRSVILNVNRIPEEDRKSERELWAEFNELKPQLLGALFTIVSHGLEKLPDIKVEKLPRMADFAKWGYAVNDCISTEAIDIIDHGYDIKETVNRGLTSFCGILEANEEKRLQESLESDPVTQAAIYAASYARGNSFSGVWKGTITAFYNSFFPNPDSIFYSKAPDTIRSITKHELWPKNPSAMGRALRKSEGLLREFGVTLSFGMHDGDRIVHITGSSITPRFRGCDEDSRDFHSERQEAEEKADFEAKKESDEKRTFAEEERLKNVAFHKLILDQMKRGEQFYGNCNIVTTQKKLHEIPLKDFDGNQRSDDEVLDDIYRVLTDKDLFSSDAYTEEDEEEERKELRSEL